MTFSNDVESKVINSVEGASLDPQIYPVNTKKKISAVEVNVRQEEGEDSNIYGIRFLDEGYLPILDKQWRRSSKAKWVRTEIPEGMEVIGFHGMHDENYIKQLGLVLWTPNTKAIWKAKQQFYHKKESWGIWRASRANR